jgi:transposase
LPVARSKRNRATTSRSFELRSPLHCLTDLSQIDGLAPYSALRVISAIGTDMSRWPSEHRFTSWLTLAPKNKIFGGRLLGSRTQRSPNHNSAIFMLAAMNLGRTQIPLRAFYRRPAYRVGKAKAITAPARKLAILVYRTLKGDFVYQDPAAVA